MEALILEVTFQLINRITQSQLSPQIQFQSQLLLLTVMLEMLSLIKRILDGLKQSIFHTMALTSHKISLLHPLMSNPSSWFSTMLQSEEKKMSKLSSKNNTLNKLRILFHLSLEMQLTQLTDKLGGLTMIFLAIWDSRFKFQLSEDKHQQPSQWTKTTLVMGKLMQLSMLLNSLLIPQLWLIKMTLIGKLIQRCQDLILLNTLEYWVTTTIETSLNGELLQDSLSTLIMKQLKLNLSLTPNNISQISKIPIQLPIQDLFAQEKVIMEVSFNWLIKNRKQLRME